tara:strand:- start:1031 stop:1303 length:273 start_codon:yes stop_codon:yes gene_type:complete
MLSIFYASAHGISLKKYRKDTMNIVEIKTAMDVLKPLFSASQITELNDMVEVAIANYHDGLTVASINEDLNVLGITPMKDIFEDDNPFDS